MRLSLRSCTILGFLSLSLTAADYSYAQAGSPGRDTAQTKSKEIVESSSETPKKENKDKLKPKTNPANTRRVEDGANYVPPAAGGVSKNPKVDCPPAGTGGTPLPECQEGSTTETTKNPRVPVTKP